MRIRERCQSRSACVLLNPFLRFTAPKETVTNLSQKCGGSPSILSNPNFFPPSLSSSFSYPAVMATMRSPYTGSSRKLVLAFDIGTTYSGVSYALLYTGLVPEIASVVKYSFSITLLFSKVNLVMQVCGQPYDGKFQNTVHPTLRSRRNFPWPQGHRG